jgi:tRNA(fMet)-specific endonuclease VapC
MALIVDADVIIAGEKGAFELENWLRSQAEEIELAAITVAELWHGVARASASSRTAREQYVRAIVEALPIVPYTTQTAYEHARIWAELKAGGKMIGSYDLIVAATALERGSTVVTFNVRHFRRIRGLRVMAPQKK